MKKFFVLLVMMALTIVIYSQAPQKMSYQAVIRNSSGQLVTDHAVGMKISILQGSASGTVVYSETYSPAPQTNANGLVTIEIGSGTPVSGTFSSINWGSGTYYLKTETDPSGGTNYTVIGTSQLISVPYSLYSESASTATDAVTLAGDQNITGVKTFSHDIMVNALTIGKGNNPGTTNTAIGVHTLYSNVSGYGNTAVGYLALNKNTTGIRNTAIGDSALFSNTTGCYNNAIGFQALAANTEGHNNTVIGNWALNNSISGKGNTSIGFEALYLNTTGSFNTAIGRISLAANTTGVANTALGDGAGYANQKGNNNVYLGYEAGYFETGSNKLYIDNQKRANEADARVKALIYGVFNEDPWNQVLAVNARVGIGTSNPGTRLSIVGLTSASAGSVLVISGNNVYYMSSTRDSKDNIQPLNDDYSKILNACPVSFTDKNTGMKGIGYIAEEFEDAGLQNLLVYENGKLVSLRYDLVSVYTLEIIKEQQKHLESVEEENQILRGELDELRSDLNNLKSKLRK